VDGSLHKAMIGHQFLCSHSYKHNFKKVIYVNVYKGYNQLQFLWT